MQRKAPFFSGIVSAFQFGDCYLGGGHFNCGLRSRLGPFPFGMSTSEEVCEPPIPPRSFGLPQTREPLGLYGWCLCFVGGSL